MVFFCEMAFILLFKHIRSILSLKNNGKVFHATNDYIIKVKYNLTFNIVIYNKKKE